MKNLKKLLGLMAVSTIALVGMANVHATTGTYPNASTTCGSTSSCVASIDGTHKYSDLATALTDAQSGDTIKLLASIHTTSTSNLGTVTTVAGIGKALDKNITINLNGFGLEIGNNSFVIGEGATLTIVGNGKAAEIVKSTNATTAMFDVKEGGTLVTKGEMTIGGSDSENLIHVNGGTVKIGAGATLDVQTSKTGITVDADGGTISLNAKYGSKGTAGDGTLIDTSKVADTTKISFEGGEYYLATGPVVTVDEDITVAVNKGTFKTAAGDVFVVNDGTLMVEDGTLTAATGVVIRVKGGATRVSGGTLSAEANAAIKTEPSASEGTLTLNGGTIKAKGVFSPLYFEAGEIVYNINGNVVVEGPKNTPAIYINDSLLTGLEEDGDDDHFDGIVTGGKFLYSIVGGTADGKHTPADVTKYILGSKLTATASGNYQVVGNGSSSTPSDKPSDGQAGPGDDEPSKSPATFDAIGSLVTMAISSLGVVGTATKKLFR